MALTAALALAALPGLAGSQTPHRVEPIPDSAFQPLSILANDAQSALDIAGLDAGYRSEGTVSAATSFIEPGEAPDSGPTRRARVDQPEPDATASRKPPKYSLRGEATFYDAGHTAMRLPRGTVVIVCGDGGCLQRTVTDYGPQKPSRIIDLYRDDFFRICGCPSWSGVVDVTVHVY